MKRRILYKFYIIFLFFFLIFCLSDSYVSYSYCIEHLLSISGNNTLICNQNITNFDNPPDTTKNDRYKAADSIENTDYLDGISDGRKFHNANGAFTASFITTSLIPPVGLVTTLAISLTPVHESIAKLPYPELKNNSEYFKGYLKGAKNAKITKSWIGFGSGLVFFGGILFVINYIYLQ